MKQYIAAILMINAVLIGFPISTLAEEAPVQETPQTIEEAETFGLAILERLPDAVRDIWYNQALPLWWNMWVWTKGFWDQTLGAKVEALWQKLWSLTGQETPNIQGEFRKETQEMQKDFWERFKDLLK